MDFSNYKDAFTNEAIQRDTPTEYPTLFDYAAPLFSMLFP
jgi:hypothetical protein